MNRNKRSLICYLIFILFLMISVSYNDFAISQDKDEMINEQKMEKEIKESGYKEGKLRPGDRCTVSDQVMDYNDVVLLVQGRRVPLKRQAVDIFLENPEKYFSKLEPKSALFTEDMNKGKPMSLDWFYFGIYVLIGLVFSAITAQISVGKGLSPIPWFFAGLIFNVFAFLAVLLMKSEEDVNVPEGLVKVPLTADPVTCPVCGFENHPSAKNCSRCGNNFTPTKKSEVDKAGIS